jgi:hypothetical protein
MSLNVSTQENYDIRLKAFMVSVEGEKLPVYLDIKKNPTIGWGFALNTPHLNETVLEYFIHTVLRVNVPGLALSI